MDKKYYVYDHISPSGKHYIGITCQRLSQRWGKGGKNYLKKLKNGNYRHPAFAAAIEKYGWDAFEHSILFHNCSEELAKKLEVAFIAYWTERRLSYNCTDGGDTGMRPKLTSEERKAKQKEQCKRYWEEHREELSAKRKERNATDAEFREKHKEYNKKWHQEHRERLNAKSRQYRQEHKEECAAREAAYREAHREERNAKQLQRYYKQKEKLLNNQKYVGN